MRFEDYGTSDKVGKFLKIEEGKPVTCVFRGNPAPHWIRWENGKSVAARQGEPDAKFRFRINAIVKEGGGLEAKVWEASKTVYDQLKELHSEFDLESTFVKISRTGRGTETRYTIIPIPKLVMDKTTRERIEAIELHDLGQNSAAKPPKEIELDVDDNDEVPF